MEIANLSNSDFDALLISSAKGDHNDGEKCKSIGVKSALHGGLGMASPLLPDFWGVLTCGRSRRDGFFSRLSDKMLGILCLNFRSFPQLPAS